MRGGGGEGRGAGMRAGGDRLLPYLLYEPVTFMGNDIRTKMFPGINFQTKQ